MVIERSTLLIGGAGLLGMAIALAVPVVSYARMRQAEHAAADVLRAVAVAQTAFRAGAGRGAYAADLAALTTPCPGEPASAREQSERILAASSREGARDASRYVFSLRAAQGAKTMGTDCHGRATASEYRNKLLLVQDALTLHRSDGALVRVTAPLLPHNARPADLTGFIRALYPILTQHPPE